MDKTYYKYCDVLRIMAILMIVTLHIAAQGFYIFNPNWDIALVYNVLGRVGVPIMFMVSGACLLPRCESLKKWSARLIKRILLPYCCWSIIYMIYNYTVSDGTVSITNFFLEPPFFHLWFIFQYLTFQFSLPLLRNFWNNKETTIAVKKYVIILALSYGCVLDFIQPVLGFAVIGFTVSCIPYYVGFALLGAYFSDERTKVSNRKLFLIYILCSISTFFLTYIRSHTLGQPVETFLVYASPLTIVGAVCLFRMISQISFHNIPKNLIQEISAVTFAIYLMHPLLLDICQRLSISVAWNTFNPIIWIPVFSFFIFLFSGLLAWCFQKVISFFRILFL